MHAEGLALSLRGFSCVCVFAGMIGMNLWHSCISQLIHLHTLSTCCCLFDLNPSILFLFCDL